VSALVGEILGGPIRQVVLGSGQGRAVSFEGDLGKGQGAGTGDRCERFLQPGQAELAVGVFGGVAQSEKSPAGGEYERVAVDAVDAGVATIPAAAGAHAVIEETYGQGAAVLNGFRKLPRRGEVRSGKRRP
jgi:hypothetical protein